jgi:hypothetical protein
MDRKELGGYEGRTESFFSASLVRAQFLFSSPGVLRLGMEGRECVSTFFLVLALEEGQNKEESGNKEAGRSPAFPGVKRLG